MTDLHTAYEDAKYAANASGTTYVVVKHYNEDGVRDGFTFMPETEALAFHLELTASIVRTVEATR
jgi:hypothetical protein